MPGTRFRFGWDAIIGLLPGGGDLVTGLMGAAIVFHAHRLRVPKVVQLRMVGNIALDILIGLVPLGGDLVDVFWKSNTRNLALLDRFAGGAVKPGAADWIFVTVVITALVLIAVIPIVLLWWGLAVLINRGLF